MRAALFGLLIACGTAEALQPDGGTFDVNGPVWAAALAPPPWFGSLCHTAADCVPVGQAVPSGVTCQKLWPYTPGTYSVCAGGTLACVVFVVDGGKGAESACGPRTCCEGPVDYPSDGGPWRRIPGKGACGAMPAYCNFRYGYPGWDP